MSRSRKSTPADSQKSERLQLACAISNMVTKSDQFISAVEHFKTFTKESLNDIDMEITSKKVELEVLEEEFKVQRKNGQIKCDLFLQEYRRKGAVELLKESDEEPINSTELRNLRSRLQSVTEEHAKELEDVRRKEKQRGEQAKNAALGNQDLKHKAEVAEMTASVKQYAKEVESLQATIANLRHELSEQRKLTKEVAEAGKQGAITVNSAK